MAKLEVPVKADITGIEKLIDELKGLQTYKMYEGADQTLVDLDDVVKIFADHVVAEVGQPEVQQDGTLVIDTDKYSDVKRVLVQNGTDGTLYYADADPQWIPCSVKLPDDLEEVNVTWVNHKPEPYYDFIKDKPFTASAVYYKGDWYWYSSVCTDLLAERGENEIDKIDDAIEITAWMPLPEPYKGES